MKKSNNWIDTIRELRNESIVQDDWFLSLIYRVKNLTTKQKLSLLEAMGIPVDEMHLTKFVRDKSNSGWHYESLREYIERMNK